MKKIEKLKTNLLKKIHDYEDELSSNIIVDCGDVTMVRPNRKEKLFSKQEIINIINETYNSIK